MIRHCKARRGRRVLVPRPLNSLLCIRQQQQYKQTPQQEPWTPRSLRPPSLLFTCIHVMTSPSNVILTAWLSTVLALRLKVLTLECSVGFICEFHWVWGLNALNFWPVLMCVCVVKGSGSAAGNPAVHRRPLLPKPSVCAGLVMGTESLRLLQHKTSTILKQCAIKSKYAVLQCK